MSMSITIFVKACQILNYFVSISACMCTHSSNRPQSVWTSSITCNTFDDPFSVSIFVCMGGQSSNHPFSPLCYPTSITFLFTCICITMLNESTVFRISPLWFSIKENPLGSSPWYCFVRQSSLFLVFWATSPNDPYCPFSPLPSTSMFWTTRSVLEIFYKTSKNSIHVYIHWVIWNLWGWQFIRRQSYVCKMVLTKYHVVTRSCHL